MLPGASLPPTVAKPSQQKVVGLGCCADTETPVGKEGAALPAAYEVAQCSLFDAPPQSEPTGCHLDLGR